MFDLSLGIVNDPNEAEDIVQESFLVAFEKVGALLGMTSFSTWLKKLVRDLSIDSWRKNNVIIG
jgi:DNA-directed RNA polymerase specialized sigma24 family protein